MAGIYLRRLEALEARERRADPNASRIEFYDGPAPLPADVVLLAWDDEQGAPLLPHNGADTCESR